MSNLVTANSNSYSNHTRSTLYRYKLASSSFAFKIRVAINQFKSHTMFIDSLIIIIAGL